MVGDSICETTSEVVYPNSGKNDLRGRFSGGRRRADPILSGREGSSTTLCVRQRAFRTRRTRARAAWADRWFFRRDVSVTTRWPPACVRLPISIRLTVSRGSRVGRAFVAAHLVNVSL